MRLQMRAGSHLQVSTGRPAASSRLALSAAPPLWDGVEARRADYSPLCE